MTEIEIRIHITAPPEVCFDLARDVDLHALSLAHTGERVVDRPASGFLKVGDEVEFEGRHLGVRQRLRARITALDRPRWFRDEMVRGAFKTFVHDHLFEPTPRGTWMRDQIRFEAPFGRLGSLAERLVLRRYLRRLIQDRAEAIRREAESRA